MCLPTGRPSPRRPRLYIIPLSSDPLPLSPSLPRSLARSRGPPPGVLQKRRGPLRGFVRRVPALPALLTCIPCPILQYIPCPHGGLREVAVALCGNPRSKQHLPPPKTPPSEYHNRKQHAGFHTPIKAGELDNTGIVLFFYRYTPA